MRASLVGGPSVAKWPWMLLAKLLTTSRLCRVSLHRSARCLPCPRPALSPLFSALPPGGSKLGNPPPTHTRATRPQKCSLIAGVHAPAPSLARNPDDTHRVLPSLPPPSLVSHSVSSPALEASFRCLSTASSLTSGRSALRSSAAAHLEHAHALALALSSTR